MMGQDLCIPVIQAIHDGLPVDPGEMIGFLHLQVAGFRSRPCFYEVISEVGRIHKGVGTQ